MNRSDAELVEAATSGDHDASSRLVHKYETAILSVMYRWTGNASDAQDLTQECFVKAFEKLPQLREPERFAGWLRIIAENMARSWLRAAATPRQVSLEEIQIEPVTVRSRSPDKVVKAKQGRESAVDLLDLLSDKSAVAARMFYIDGLSQREIADLLEVEISTVEGRLHRCRKRLRSILGKPAPSKEKELLLKLTTCYDGKALMDRIRIEIGSRIVQFVTEAEPNLVAAIAKLRAELENDERIALPPVRIRDKVTLPSLGYSLHVNEAVVAEGEAETEVSAVALLCADLKETVIRHKDQLHS